MKRQASHRTPAPADIPHVFDMRNISIFSLENMSAKTIAEIKEEVDAQAKTTKRKIKIGTVLITLDTREQLQCNAMLDTGCETTSIDRAWVKSKGLNLTELPTCIKVLNANGSENKDGSTQHILRTCLCIGRHEEQIEPLVTKLGGDCPLFLGLDWFQEHNPDVDWRTGHIKFRDCPKTCHVQNVTIHEEEDTPTPKYFEEYPEVFTDQEHVPLPPHRDFDQEINLKDDKPVNFRPYPLTKDEKEHLKKWIQGSLEAGQYRPSKSEYASPMFFKHEPQKDGTTKLRLLIDYWALNGKTIKDRYPLLNIRIVAEELKGDKWFTKMDVRWGYYNVRIKEGHEYKAAICTPFGTFEPTVIQMGLSNAPSTFQRYMEYVLREQIKTGRVKVYIDDILIHTRTKKENRTLTREVLKALQEHHIYVKPNKCEFEQPKITFLGMDIEPGKIKPGKGRVEAIKAWPTPKNKKQLQQFLGLMNYYRRFIKGFAEVAEPMH